MTTPDQPAEGFAAAIVQISDHAERIAALDGREAAHYREIAARLRELAKEATAMTTRLDGIGGTVAGHAALLASLDGLDQQVAALADQVAEIAPRDDDTEAPAKIYRPIPPPRWWSLTADERDAAVARLRAWVEQIYQPGYGRLGAMLAPCWDQHPLCLFMLDWLSELWSLLYLTPHRTSASLAAQAEWQTRLLPTAAEQMHMETSDCAHSPDARRRQPTLATHLNRP